MNALKKRTARPPVTLKAVADLVGLSSGTVSLVLNHAPQSIQIPQRTKNRIFAAARKLDYQPNLFARALRTKQLSATGTGPEALGNPPGALMFIGAEHLQRAIVAIREAGLRVPGDVSVIGCESIPLVIGERSA